MNTPNNKHMEQLESALEVKQAQFQETLKSNSLDALWDTGVSLVIKIDEIIAEIGELVHQYNTEIHEIVRTPAEVDVNHLLDEIGARMEHVLSRASEGSVDEQSFFAQLGIDQFEIDEMLVDTKPSPERQEGERTHESNEHMVMQKLRMLVGILYAHDCRTKDFYTVHGKNRPGTMRYRPYVLVVIPKWNRMVLINAGYGAATFVIPGLHGWKEISTRDGDELQEELGAHRIAYYGETRSDGDEQWKKEVSKYLFANNEQNDTLDMKGLQEQEVYRYHIQHQVPTPEAWMGMSYREKQHFKPYVNKGLNAIARIFEVKGHPISNSRVIAELGMKIYGAHKVFDGALAENLTESWSEKDWKIKLLEKVPTPEMWMGMSVAEKLNFKPYGGWGLIAIASIFGVKGNSLGSSRVMAELGMRIYGADYECIECEIWSEKDWQMKLIEKVPTPDAWMKMSRKEKKHFKPYGGKGLSAIAYIFGVVGDPIGYRQVMAELGMKIYGVHKVFDDALAENPTESWTREDWQMKLIEQVPTPEAWMEMSYTEKQYFKPYGGKGLYAIAGIFGVKGDPASNSRVMAELGVQIYGAHQVFDDTLVVDLTKSWTQEVWKKKLVKKVPTPEIWMEMDITEKKNFKPYGGKGLSAIAGIFGITENPISKCRVMAELGVQIYGVGYECIECEFWSEKQWQMKLVEKVLTPEIWMGMSRAKKKNFKPYGGKGLMAIARIFGVKGDPVGNNRVMVELGRKIYGAHEIFDK